MFRSQFMLYNILSKFANFNIEHVRSTLGRLEGYGSEIGLIDRDIYEIAKETGFDFQNDRTVPFEEIGDNLRGICILNIDTGILNCPQPLLPNTEVKFSFDRAPATFSLFYKDKVGNHPTDLDGKVVPIKDCYLELEYVSSHYLRNLHAQIVDKPITYHYDDCQIYMKDVAKGSQTLRINSLCGGLTPEYIFAGFMPSKCLDPDFLTTSVRFVNPDIREACITLNGAPVQGYPISCIFPGNSTQFYSRFIDTTGRTKKTSVAGSIGFETFINDFMVLSHQFEGEQSNEGWIGFDIKFNKPSTIDYTFGKSYFDRFSAPIPQIFSYDSF